MVLIHSAALSCIASTMRCLSFCIYSISLSRRARFSSNRWIASRLSAATSSQVVEEDEAEAEDGCCCISSALKMSLFCFFIKMHSVASYFSIHGNLPQRPALHGDDR